MPSPKEKSYNSKVDPLRASSPDDPILPIERWTEFRRKLPYGVIKNGFKVDPDDACLLVPDREQIFWIEQAFDHLQNGNTLRETSEWLGQKLHRSMTHQTISNLYKEYRQPHTFFKTEKRTGPKASAATRKLIAEKNKAKAAVRRLAKLEAESEAKKKARAKRLKPTDFDQPRSIKETPSTPVFTNVQSDTTTQALNILFQPNPGPQYDFLTSTEQEVLYGGAAGGEDIVFLPPPFAVMRQNKTRELLECRKENQQPSLVNFS